MLGGFFSSNLRGGGSYLDFEYDMLLPSFKEWG